MRRTSLGVVTAVAVLLAFPLARAGAVDAVVGVSPSTLDLGIVEKGLSGTADVTISNTGTATLTVTDISAANGQYTASPTSFTVDAGLSQVVTVTFMPTVVGCETATLTIAHDGTGDSSVDVTGLGSVTPPVGDLQGDTRIAHESTVDGNTDIYIADIDGSNRIRVTTDPGQDRMPTWNETGTRLAFASDRTGTWQVHTINVDLSGLTNVSANASNDWLPKWSPDGTTIAFESDRSGSGAEVWLMDDTGANQRALPGLAGMTDAGHPGWSPDDSKIVLQARPEGNWEVYVIDIDGQDLTNLTNEAGSIDEQPSWSSDGSEITFRDDNDLTAISACGPVARSYGGGTVSSWSPDGEWIVYGNLSNGISVVSADGASTLSWTAVGSMERTFEWSPFLSPIDPQVVVASPTDGDQLAAGTTSTTLSVTISNHDAPGYWAWQLDTPFPDTGGVPVGATSVTAGTFTDTLAGLSDSTTYSAYVALVDGATDQLLDAMEYPSSRDSVTFHVGPPTITIASPAGVLDPDTTSAPVVVGIAAHPAPGYWVWKLDEVFPDSGVAGGTVGDTVPIDGLVVGSAHTVYAALVDSSGDLLSPSITDTSSFVVGLPPDAVQVMDTQGGGTTVTVPIEIYDVSTLDVAGVDMIVTYDSAILTPADDGAGNTTAVQTGAAVVPAEWYVDQNVVTPGELIVSMASDFATYLIGAGVIVTVEFDVAAEATAGTVTTISITGLELNEGAISASTIAGTFTLLDIVYGDVTGNDSVGAFDAAWVLEYVANELIGTTIQFPIETSTPPWASLPLEPAAAREVADVDDSGAPQAEPADIAAIDASHILMKRVGKIVLFVAEGGAPPAPSSQPSVLAYGLRGAATSSRPGAQITISLDASAVEEVYAGELRLDFDPALLRLTDVTLRGGGGASQRPLLAHRMGDGQVAVAFASARPIESTDSTLDVTFQATRHIAEPAEGTIRSSHLRLNGSRMRADFAYPFRVEPYRFALMANYPNPFNPETWIPFELAEGADVTVRIYALDGRIARTLDLGYRPMGEYHARESAAYWDGRNELGERVASGVYVYELLAGDRRAVRRMVIAK